MDTPVRDEATYDSDFYAWTQEQAARLRAAAAAGSNLPLDWENLAEEIESVGKSDFRSLTSHLATVIEHLLKLEYSTAAYPRDGWRVSVRKGRRAIGRLIKDSPSFRSRLGEALVDAWDDGLDDALRGLRENGLSIDTLPETCPYTVDQVLDDGWFPQNRHGLT